MKYAYKISAMVALMAMATTGFAAESYTQSMATGGTNPVAAEIEFHGQVVGAACTLHVDSATTVKPIELGEWHRATVDADETNPTEFRLSFSGCSASDVKSISLSGQATDGGSKDLMNTALGSKAEHTAVRIAEVSGSKTSGIDFVHGKEVWTTNAETFPLNSEQKYLTYYARIVPDGSRVNVTSGDVNSALTVTVTYK